MIAPLVRLRSLSEGQNQWLSSSPATAGFPQSLSCSCARPRPTYRPLPSNNPGNLTMLAAICLASSRVSSLAAARRARLLVEVDVGQRLPVGADAARTGGAPMLMAAEEM